MKRWIKTSLAAVASLAALGAATLATGAWLGERKAQRRIELAVAPVAVPGDAAAMARGRYLFASRGCVDCHGADGAGRAFIDAGGFYVKAPNISPGPGSVVAGYRAEDWVRTVRHGVKPDGRPLFIMPAEDYSRWSDADLGALVAWLRQMPPAAGGGMQARVPVLVKVLYAVGVIRDAAEKIDHRQRAPAVVAADGSPAHGAYVAAMCVGCHGATLTGGKIAGAPPDWPAAADLTPAGSAMARYPSAEAFIAMLRSGRRPDGSAVSKVMPFESLRELDDADARALYRHLRQLGPVQVAAN
ncbi:MAG: c-type cytochrome [Burkholderiaceae bacterium]|nr:c-type cytochrome [Burkholderiaceae bacterium]